MVPLKGERLICKSLIRKDCLSTEREKIGRKILGSSAMQQGFVKYPSTVRERGEHFGGPSERRKFIYLLHFFTINTLG